VYPQGYPPPQPPGYPPPGYPPPGYSPYGGYPPPPPPRRGLSGLAIGLIVGAIVLVVGFGGCLALVVLGAAVSSEEEDAPVGGPTAANDPTPAPVATEQGGQVTDVSKAIEGSLRAKGIPATRVTCPPGATGSYTCELVIASGDSASLHVTTTSSGVRYDAPGVAFLDGVKLEQLFIGSAGKIDPNLRVPCFSGMLMKKVGSTFKCDVVKFGKNAGDVTVNVKTTDGHVGMKYTVKK
jgi:hypothetical protein